MKESNEKWIELVKNLYLKNNVVGLIPAFMYDLLVEEKEIDLSEEEIEMIKNQTENRMYQDAAKAGTRALKEFAHLKNSPIYENFLIPEFKRQAVANYFTVQNEIENF